MSDTEPCKFLCTADKKAETPGCKAVFEERPTEGN